MCLDPGANLGISIVEMDVMHTSMKVLHSETMFLNKIAEKKYAHIVEEHGLRFARFFALRNLLLYLMKKWQIDAVIHENAFLHMKRVTAGISLSQYVLFIQLTAKEYDPMLPVFGYSPFEVKASVKAKKLNSDKKQINNALLLLPDLDISLIDINTLDEHSVDSIAIGYCYFDKNRKKVESYELSSIGGKVR